MTVKKYTYLQEEEMIRRAVQALLETLGPIETSRFLTLPRTPRLESVLRHQVWQEGLDKEQFFDQVFGTQA